SRTYNSADDFAPSPMGLGWVHSYDWEYFENPVDQPRLTGTLRRGDGRRGVQPDDISFTYSSADNTYTLVTHDHTQYLFAGAYTSPHDCFDGTVTLGWVLTTITGAAGDRMDLPWSGLVPAGTARGAQSNGYAKVLLSVRDTQGRTYSFGYDALWDL